MIGTPELPDDKVTRYVLFYRYRKEGYSETRLAASMKAPSAQELYRSLNNDGFPVCVRCGGYSGRQQYCEDCLPSRRRPAGSGEEALELPPAGEAKELFEDTTELLGRIVDELPFVKQWLKDRRFVTESVHSQESGRSNQLIRKKDFDLPPGILRVHWRSLCERYGQDPDVEEFRVPISNVRSGGAQWYPHDLLVALVAAYAVTGKPLEPLLTVLHPDANQEDARKANDKRDELVLRARQLAGLVRGSREAVKSGRKAESITPIEQDFARTLHDEEWLSELETMGMTQDKIKRLKRLRLPHAESE